MSVNSSELWGRFLHARHKLIAAWIAEGKSFEEIAIALSMESTQVRLIGISKPESVYYRQWFAMRDPEDPRGRCDLVYRTNTSSAWPVIEFGLPKSKAVSIAMQHNHEIGEPDANVWLNVQANRQPRRRP